MAEAQLHRNHQEVVQEEAGVEEILTAFKRIEELENFGISKPDIKKFKEGGFHTIESIAHATIRYLIHKFSMKVADIL